MAKMNEDVPAEPPPSGSEPDSALHVSASDSSLNALHITVSEPLNILKKRDSSISAGKGSSPLTRSRRGIVGGSLARAFRKVFRSRTPSPSTDEREDEVNSESEEVKCEVSSDSECHEGLQSRLCVPDGETGDISELPTLSRLNNNSVVTTPSDEKCSTSMKDFQPSHTPMMGKSQTYSALSEALHHAFLEGMICSGAEDISILSCEDIISKSDTDSCLNKSIEFPVNNKKSTSSVLNEVREKLRSTLDTQPHYSSLAVPSRPDRSRSHSELSDIGTDDDSSSQHSQEEKQESLTHLDIEHKSLLGNLFSSRRTSLMPTADDSKTEEGATQPSPRLKRKDQPTTAGSTEHGKGHKKLGDRLIKVAEVSGILLK